MDIVQEMLATFNDDPNLLKKALTDNESWMYDDDIETQAQSFQWKRPEEPRSTRQVRPNVKVLLPVFFDCNDVVHQKFLPQGGRPIRNTTLKL